jgi:hypothetical protein
MDVISQMYLLDIGPVLKMLKAKEKKTSWLSEVHEERENYRQYFSIRSFYSFHSLVDSHVLAEFREFNKCMPFL